MQGNELLGFIHGTTPHTAKFLHVGANTEQKAEVHAKGTDIGAGLAADPEDTEMAIIVKLDELALVDGSDTQLTLDGRDEGRALEQSTRQGLESLGELCLTTRQLVVQTNDGNVFLSGTLLGLDQTCGTINADNETSCDLGVEGSAVASLFATAPTLVIALA